MTVEAIQRVDERVTIAAVNVNEAGLMGLRVQVDKLNKRAMRKGMAEVIVTVVRDELVVHNQGDPDEYTERRYDVEINGCEPRINGWRLIVRVEFNDTIGQVVRIVPGVDDDGSFERYRTVEPICEHCNSRRNRNDIFVLEHRDGRRKIVGRNCLADFIRSGDAETLAYYAERCEWLANLGPRDCEDYAYDECGYGSREKPVKALEEFMPVVAMMTRRLGWMGRAKARELNESEPYASHTATANHVSYYFYGRGRHHAEFIRENELYVNDNDTELADRAVAWACDVDSSGNEYLDTIKRIAQAGMVDMARLDGYAASIIVAYQKSEERRAEREEKAKNAPRKDYIGEVKERLRNVPVRVVRVRYYENDWGTKTIVAMEADLPDGAVAPITWFASGSLEFDEGADYVMTATVKGHEDNDRFGKQTIVQRAKLVEAE